MLSYSRDDDEILRDEAKPLIAKHHSHLLDANIFYIFRNEEKKEQGQIEYGEVRKTNDFEKFLTGADFILSIFQGGWDTLLLPQKRTALMDHLLCSCQRIKDKDGFDKEDKYGNPMWQVIKPDGKFFFSNLSRHGAWNEQAQEVFGIAKRHEFGDEKDE